MRKLFMILPLALILCFMVGCQDREERAELEEFRALEAQEKQNVELVKRYVAAINQKNFEAFMELLSSDYSIYSPPGGSEQISREKHIENYKAAAQEFKSFAWKIEDLLAAGDKVICRVTVSGIYQGNVPDIKVTGKQLSFSLITIMRIANGKITEEWTIDDMLGLARQLGMELKPKEEK